MTHSIEIIIFYLLFVDAIIANLMAWIGPHWYANRFRSLSRIFPMSKGWTTLYLTLTLFVGYLIFF